MVHFYANLSYYKSLPSFYKFYKKILILIDLFKKYE